MSKQVCVASKIDIWGENLFLDVLIFLLCKESYGIVNFESGFICVQ